MSRPLLYYPKIVVIISIIIINIYKNEDGRPFEQHCFFINLFDVVRHLKTVDHEKRKLG